jgi:hypothetical protein
MVLIGVNIRLCDMKGHLEQVNQRMAINVFKCCKAILAILTSCKSTVSSFNDKDHVYTEG